jgi:DNA integrity scanning protein DisA with diadenylate cyclase activity
MKNILNTFKEIARIEGMTISKLEVAIGASKGVLSRAIREGTDIQSKWIVSLVDKYPRYSAEWMLTGKGPILKTDSHQGNGNGHVGKGNGLVGMMEDKNSITLSQQKQLHALKQANQALQDANESLKETKDILKIRIKELETKLKDLEK